MQTIMPLPLKYEWPDERTPRCPARSALQLSKAGPNLQDTPLGLAAEWDDWDRLSPRCARDGTHLGALCGGMSEDGHHHALHGIDNPLGCATFGLKLGKSSNTPCHPTVQTTRNTNVRVLIATPRPHVRVTLLSLMPSEVSLQLSD